MDQKTKLKIIEKVANNHQYKKFGSHTEQDIKQTVWVILLEKIEEYDFTKAKETNEEQALENWLNKVAANRLRNFYRDNFVVPQRLHIPEKQNNLLNPVHIDKIQDSFYTDSLENIITEKSLLYKIANSLDILDFDILESLLSGENISTYYKNRLNLKIQEILYG